MKAFFKQKQGAVLWALPSLLVASVIAISAHLDFRLVLPFLLLAISVMVAGVYGGLRSGVLAGLIATAAILYVCFLGCGPSELTGGPWQVAIGSALYILIGAKLGQLKDQCDTCAARYLEQAVVLKTALKEEKQKSLNQLMDVAEDAARLEIAVRIAGIGHYRWNVATGECEYCSEQHAAHFGMTPRDYQALTVGKAPYTGYVHEDDREQFIQHIDSVDHGDATYFEYRVRLPNGAIRFLRQIDEPIFSDDGVPIAVVGASLDLTELREAEARLRQSQRIEAIGTLTGGVAHDFNNLLAIILGNLEMAARTKDDKQRLDLIDKATTATQRGASLTKNLLSFSRRAHLNPTRLNLNQLVSNTMKWSSRVLPATISIENSLMAGLWDTELDSTSVENAIINILLNARDAMPDGGKVTIETANMRVGEEYVRDRSEDIQPGRYVMLAISDTGHGIEPDNIDKVFEPFFTDKPVGMGSGLGLSMVQGFMKQSGGAIRIYSEVGVGTTFKLYFRAVEHLVEVALDSARKPKPRAQIDSEHRILLAEDEKEVMRMLMLMLEDAGYNTTTASSGDVALTAFKDGDNFDLLITDVVMPGRLQGPGLAKAIREIQPNIPCIFLSGYAAEATVHGNGLKPSDIRLMKPVRRSEFLDAVATALNTVSDTVAENE